MFSGKMLEMFAPAYPVNVKNIHSDSGQTLLTWILKMVMMMMMIYVLWQLLCTWQAKWAERPPKVMKRS